MQVMRDGTAPATSGFGSSGRLRGIRGLVVAEVALAMVLLVVAGLLMRSFLSLFNVETGYDPTNVLTFQVMSPTDRDAESQIEQLAIADALTQRLVTLPQVEAVGFTQMPPLAGMVWRHPVTVPGVSADAMAEQAPPEVRYVSPGYLSSIGVRLVEGRWFGAPDTDGAPRVLLVNRAFARLYSGNTNPMGAVVTTLDLGWEIVGLVEDVRQHLEVDPEPTFYIDFRQLPMLQLIPPGPLHYAVHSDGVPTRLVPSVRDLVRQVEPRAALESVATLESLVSSSIARPRFYAVLIGIFAMVAAGLATIGVYGVMAYAVTQRSGSVGLNNFPRYISGLRADCGRCRVVHGVGRRMRRPDRRRGPLEAHREGHLTQPPSWVAARPGTFQSA